MQTGKTSKVCLLIPDGVGIRNYLYSDVLDGFGENEIVIWHALPSEVIQIASSIHQKQIGEIALKTSPESKFQKYLRESARFARLHYIASIDNNQSAFFQWMPKKRSVLEKGYNFMVEATGKWAAKNYNRILKLEKRYTASVRKSAAYQNAMTKLKEDNITTILCTHQRSTESMTIMQAATDLGIRAIVAIFSWDNLPKATLFCRGNQYFVWSSYMKNEMLKYYPEIPETSLVITGTPQFDFYRRPAWIETKEAFYGRFNIPLDKKIICYSANDMMSTPHDGLFLEEVCQAIEALPENERPVLMFRPLPSEPPTRYQKALKQYEKFIVVAAPIWRQAPDTSVWHLYYPLPEDLKLLVNIAYHCTGVINIGSTMGVDFSLFNKPTIYLKYNHALPYPRFSTLEVFDFQHFRTMTGLDAVGWAYSPAEITGKLLELLQHPENVGTEKDKWRKLITGDMVDVGKNMGKLLRGK